MSQYLARGAAGAVLIALLGAGVAQAEPSIPWWVIAGGGGPAAGGDVTLHDTLGQPVIGPAAGSGEVALNAGYWAAASGCAAAPAVAPVVTIAIAGADAVLSWAAHPANAQHQVWVSTNPYFDPDDPGGVTPVVTAGTTYTDAGAAASLVNHFYVVRGVNACAVASIDSNRTGEFTFGLVPGSL